MFCYILPLGFVSGCHPSFMLFNLFINPIFKTYIEIMVTYQSVNLSLQLHDSSVWITEKASLCCTHAVAGAEMPVVHWSWMFDLKVTKEGQTPAKKKEFLPLRVVDKEHRICFYLPQPGESEARTADLNEVFFWGLFCLQSQSDSAPGLQLSPTSPTLYAGRTSIPIEKKKCLESL